MAGRETQELAERIRKRIEVIPISNGSYISVRQKTLRNVLEPRLLEKIAEEAADETTKALPHA